LRRYDSFEQRISGIFLSQINILISNFFSNHGSVTRLMILNKIPTRTTCRLRRWLWQRRANKTKWSRGKGKVGRIEKKRVWLQVARHLSSPF